MPATKLRELHVDRLVVAGEPVAGGAQSPPPTVPDSEAKKVAELRDDLNNLLAALRQAGVIS